MLDTTFRTVRSAARTNALRRVLAEISDEATSADLLFLERWELHPSPGTAAALRIGQIRRANPQLAAEIRAEIDGGLTLPGRPMLD